MQHIHLAVMMTRQKTRRVYSVSWTRMMFSWNVKFASARDFFSTTNDKAGLDDVEPDQAKAAGKGERKKENAPEIRIKKILS